MSNVNVSTITNAVYELILDDLELQELLEASHVVRSGFVNVNPGLTPWAGVYKSSVEYTPRSLGQHSGTWQLTVGTQVLLQVFSADTGEDAENKLEDLIQKLMRLIFDNLTLKGTVDMTLGFNVEYRFLEGENETSYFQMAMVTINSEVRTG